MTFHPYSQENNRSLNIFDALYGAHQSVGVVSGNEWKQVLLGSTSALVYLQAKDILHNDIKTDNILIERISNGVRALLIDFNKACHSDEGQVYKLSHKEKERYAKHHLQKSVVDSRGSLLLVICIPLEESCTRSTAKY